MNKRNRKKTANLQKAKQLKVSAAKGRPPRIKQQSEIKQPVKEARDVNSKMVFRNAKLCSQFINDNLNHPLLKNVRPEDIEDVTELYQPYLGVEFEADTVKKIRLRDEEGKETDMPLFLLPLIEHKSQVDHNAPMQLLRYMACIWHDYGKKMEQKHNGITKTKNFRYPPIIPILYFEGSGEWTASMHFGDRIWKNEIFGRFMPEFTYEVVRNHDYTNEELLARGDEMSLIMMLNKAQTAEDFTKLRQLAPEQMAIMDQILENTSEDIRKIIQDVTYALLMKMNVPVEEANEQVKWIGANRMGYLFENFEKVDIQAERRNTAKAKAEAEEAKQKLEEALAEVEEMRRKLEEAEQKLREMGYVKS